MARCKERLPGRVTHEFLQSQVEIGTGVCDTIGAARAELRELRETVAETAREFGMRMIASSTHPWAHWREQVPVDMDRYRILGAEHQSLARRMAICGMHVHAGIEDADLRVDLMSQVSYFMPHLLALSSSSPFWEGHDTGLKAFRPIIIGDLPRSGLPEIFESWNDWQELLQVLAETGMVTDPSKIWWDMRPSAKHPTLEIRICDICTWIGGRADGRRALPVDPVVPRAPQEQQPALAALPADPDPREQVAGAALRGRGGDGGLRQAGAGALPGAGRRAGRDPARRTPRRSIASPRSSTPGWWPGAGRVPTTSCKVYHAGLERGLSEHDAQAEVVDWLIAQSVTPDGPKP